MKPLFLGLFFLLLSPSPLVAAPFSTNSAQVRSATTSARAASTSATLTPPASASATPVVVSPPPEPILPSSPPFSIKSFLESETNRAALIFTAAIILILIGFYAGRQANDRPDEAEE